MTTPEFDPTVYRTLLESTRAIPWKIDWANATFAYIGDVFILQGFRGKGLSKKLMEAILSHPELQNLRRWVLATKDAHGLYAQYDFTPLKFPERWMERPAPWAY